MTELLRHWTIAPHVCHPDRQMMICDTRAHAQ